MWSKTYEDGAEIEVAYSVIQTVDEGYALAGTMFVKTDALGNVMWNKTYGGIACSLVAAADGGYALAGTANGNFWLAKTDALGNMQWNKTYGGAGEDVACALIATTDDGYLLAGDTWSFGAGGADFWLVKTDALGNIEWNQTYGGTEDDCARALVATSDGGYALAGIWNCNTLNPMYNVGFYEGGDFWLVKTDALGNMQWNKTYGGTESDLAFSLVATSDGGYALAGTWNYTIGGDFSFKYGDFWLVKTDQFGNMQWNQTYEGPMADLAYSLVRAPDGGYVLAGVCNFTSSWGQGTADAWLVKTDTLGNMQWNQTYDGRGNNWGDDWACSVIATSDGGYALAGTSFYMDYLDLEYGEQKNGDFWFVKTDENGVIPEYPSLLIPAVVLTATALLILNKKRLLRTR